MLPSACAAVASLTHPLLSADQEIYLLRRAQQGDPAALEELVAKNQRLVAKVAYRFTAIAGDSDFEDLLQYGNEGLMIAIWRFDTDSGKRFSTYAFWWIRSIMRRYALRHSTTIHRSSREGELIMIIHKAAAQLRDQLHRPPTLEEIARRSGLSTRLVGEILPMIKNGTVLFRLDAPIQPEDASDEWHDKIQSPDLPVEQQAETAILLDRLRSIVETLPERWQYVITHRYGLDNQPIWTYSQIGDALGLSRTRIHDIEVTAMIRLRRAMNGRKP